MDKGRKRRYSEINASLWAAFGFYSVMLASTMPGFLTMAQLICKAKRE